MEREPVAIAARDDVFRRGRLLEPVEFARFGDVPVLAELARQVAAGGAEGQHGRSRQIVVQWLLLDRIDTEPRGAAVGGEHDPVVLPAAHEAQATLAFVELAVARADIALDAPVVEPVPVAARNAFQTLRFGHRIHRVRGSAGVRRCRAMIRTTQPRHGAGGCRLILSGDRPETLSRTVDDLLVGAEVRERLHRCGVICSARRLRAIRGAVAAAAFASVRSLHGRIERAVVVGPAHFVPFRGIAAPSDTAFATPLGEMPVDVAAVEALSERRPSLRSTMSRTRASMRSRWSLPFLQSVFGNLPIVPLLFGSTIG